jgi:hypothetical protein
MELCASLVLANHGAGRVPYQYQLLCQPRPHLRGHMREEIKIVKHIAVESLLGNSVEAVGQSVGPVIASLRVPHVGSYNLSP